MDQTLESGATTAPNKAKRTVNATRVQVGDNLLMSSRLRDAITVTHVIADPERPRVVVLGEGSGGWKSRFELSPARRVTVISKGAEHV